MFDKLPTSDQTCQILVYQDERWAPGERGIRDAMGLLDAASGSALVLRDVKGRKREPARNIGWTKRRGSVNNFSQWTTQMIVRASDMAFSMTKTCFWSRRVRNCEKFVIESGVFRYKICSESFSEKSCCSALTSGKAYPDGHFVIESLGSFPNIILQLCH